MVCSSVIRLHNLKRGLDARTKGVLRETSFVRVSPHYSYAPRKRSGVLFSISAYGSIGRLARLAGSIYDQLTAHLRVCKYTQLRFSSQVCSSQQAVCQRQVGVSITHSWRFKDKGHSPVA